MMSLRLEYHTDGLDKLPWKSRRNATDDETYDRTVYIVWHTTWSFLEIRTPANVVRVDPWETKLS